jgi:hypothetical protein
MAVALSPIGGAGAQFFDNNGNPLSGGKLYTYEAGTTTPATTYTSLAGTTAHTNPIILDSAGRVPGGEIWLTLPDFYKFVLRTSTEVLLGTWDNIQGYSSGSVAYAATEVQIATANQTLFVLNDMFYNPSTNTLAVYVDGVNQVVNNSYVESTPTSVTFMAGLHVGAVVKFVNVNVASADASAVSYEPGFVGSVATTVQTKLRETVSVKDFGAVGDGVANDTAAIQAAVTAANNSAIVYFPAGTYKVIGTLEMPLKLSGNFTIDGNVQWTFKKETLQEGQITVTGTVLLDSVWFSKFNHIESASTVTLQSSNATWGTFWNDFGTIRCTTLIIDVDQGQSVNQNNFASCKCSGGVHIRGTAVAGIREAHNNVFVSVDTTGANLTASDGTTGVHLLNDSNQNQANTVINWYAESSGSRRVYGNWNVLGSNVDASGGFNLSGRYNSMLFAGGTGRNGSFLAAAKNVAKGADWRELTGSGIPASLAGASITVASVTNSPDSLTIGAKQTGGVTFRAIEIKYPLGSSDKVSATAWVYQEGTPSTTVEILNASGVTVASGVGSYTPLGGGWYLLRVSGTGATGAGGTEGRIRIYTTTSGALTAADFRVLGSFYVTTEGTALLPAAYFGQRVGYSTAPPTAGVWAQGDLCWNTTPTAGGVPGWVCVTSGTPGTWKAMAAVAA